MKKVFVLLFGVVLLGALPVRHAIGEEAKPAEAKAEEAKDEGPKYGKNVGDQAKPIDMVTLQDGKTVNTGRLAESKKVMLVLVNGMCNLCQNEMEALTQYKDKFAEKADVYFVAVDMNKDYAQKAYAKFFDQFPVLYDPMFALGNAVDLVSTPSTLILDKGGKIVYKGMGYQKEYLKKYMEAL